MDIVVLLRNQAQEIAEEGHDGWGNTMTFAADEIETLRKHKIELALANVGVANLNATLIEFLTEVSYTPYSDSNYLSLYEGLRTRAAVILQDIASAQQSVHPTNDGHAKSDSESKPAVISG